MKRVALSVGGPRDVEWQGERVLTSIFKDRVAGVRRVAGFNIDGDVPCGCAFQRGRNAAATA